MKSKELEQDSVVTLSELREADRSILFEWINNRKLVELNSSFSPVSWQEHCDWFDRIRKSELTRIFGIRVKEDDRLIGSCQLHNINMLLRSAELQIRLGYFPEMGRGYGSCAVKLLLAYGFGTLNLKRISLQVFADNERAINTYLKNGFVKEGILRGAAIIKNEPKDVYLMVILREDKV